jgi:hypothetical protein
VAVKVGAIVSVGSNAACSVWETDRVRCAAAVAASPSLVAVIAAPESILLQADKVRTIKEKRITDGLEIFIGILTV